MISFDESKRAIELWSNENQIIKTIEELGELQKALCKWLLFISNTPQPILKEEETVIVISVFEEICDSEIMIDQMKVLFDNDKLYGLCLAQKLSHLRDLLWEEEERVKGK